MSYRPMKIGSVGARPVQERDKSRLPKAGPVKSSFEAVLASSVKEAEAMQKTCGNVVLNSCAPMPEVTAQFEPPRADDFSRVMKIVMKHEGTSYVHKDGGRESSRMGILQSTAREYGYTGDIKNISKADAEAIYRKMWEKSGAAKLPYPLSVVHFDTYVNSPAAARRILKQAGGDVDTYLNLRERRFVRLAEIRPGRYGKYLKGWINRVNNLRTVAAQYAKTDNGSNMKLASAKRVNTRA